MIQRTSLDALPTLFDRAKRQQQVLNYLRDKGPSCNRTISQELPLDINCVTPRINELVKLGKVKEHHKDTGPTGRKVIFWSVV